MSTRLMTLGKIVASSAVALGLAACGGGGYGGGGSSPAATSGYTIGGTISGLTGSGLVLQDNGTDAKTITADGAFTFATGLAYGATYSVTVKTQPSMPTQTCTVTNGSGTVGYSNITSIMVTCV